MPSTQNAVNNYEYRNVPIPALAPAISSRLRDRTPFELNSPVCDASANALPTMVLLGSLRGANNRTA